MLSLRAVLGRPTLIMDAVWTHMFGRTNTRSNIASIVDCFNWDWALGYAIHNKHLHSASDALWMTMRNPAQHLLLYQCSSDLIYSGCR